MTIPYSSADRAAGFLQQVDAGQRRRRSRRRARRVEGEFKKEVTLPGRQGGAGKNFETEMPSFVIYSNGELNELLADKKVEIVGRRRSTTGAGSSRT